MRVFGLEIGRRKALPQNLNHPNGSWQTLFDWFPGAWQQENYPEQTEPRAFHAVFACITRIASDVGKLRPKLVVEQDGIFVETQNPAFSPVLRKPNRYQTHIQFKEHWTTSKLSTGNTYALKQRDNRGVVVALYILDPNCVTPLVSDSGDVFYQLQQDNLSGIDQAIIVPAREIIHDRINCIFHPLIGLSPIYACGLAARQGLKMQQNATKFFSNQSRASGILTAPGSISDPTAQRIKEHWQTNYSGDNYGKVAVLGDGLKYEAMSVTPVDAQMIEQMKWSAEVVCSVFHVPPFKIGLRDPKYSTAEIANQAYYSDCLQTHIENFEACMDEGLGIDTPREGGNYGVELDLDGLWRMDMSTLIDAESKAVQGTIKTPNESRKRLNLKPAEGGDSVLSQQQNFSLAALAKRDADDPFSKPTPAPSAAPTDEQIDDEFDLVADEDE